MECWWFILYFLAPCITMAQGYNFVGDSYSLGNDCYTLTPGQEWQNGAIWYNQSIDLNNAFELQFTANFGSNDAGADGMVFVLQQVDNEILGEAGGGMGFSGFSPSLGVEFDTFQNPETSDPPADHLAVLTNGVNDHQSPNNLYGPFSIAEGSENIEDGQDHIIDILWDPNTTQFRVWVDCIPRVDLNIDLLGTVFTDSPEVFWGFTGATGGFFNQQTICLDPYILGTPEQYETCPGVPVELEASAATFGTLSWEPAEFLDDPNSNTPLATVDETTEFTLTYEDLCNDQQISTTTVVVYDPNVEIGEDLSLCEGETVTIEPQGEFNELMWSDGSSGQVFEITESGTYWVEVMQGVCTASDTINVAFTSLPDWENEYGEICEGEEFTADLTDLPYDLVWFDGDVNPIRSFSEEGEYEFTLSNDECSETYSIEISVTPIPVFDLDDLYTVCEGESTILGTGLNSADLLWSTGETSSAIQVSEAGQYWATATVNSCSYSDTAQVIVESVVEFDIVGTESLCPGESGELTANVEGNVEWTNGASGNTIEINLPGTYRAQFIDENGCESSASFSVEALFLPSIVLKNQVTKCEGEEVRILAESSDDLNLLWSDGSIGSILNTDVDGEYTVSLTNLCGTTERTVRVESKLCGQSFYIPNAFSPDQDGLNDIFKVVTDDLESFELRIFNRFGQEVYYSEDAHSGWNGNFQNNGYYCQPGVYVVKYKLQFDSNTIYEGIGHLNLIR
jgi:gliding motility-associated-like protein